LHDGFTNSFRFIDYSKPVKWQPPKDYEVQVINLDPADKKEENTEDQTQSIPEFISPSRSIFEEKV